MMSKKPTTKKTVARRPARSKKASWKRTDGRAFDELRILKIESGILWTR